MSPGAALPPLLSLAMLLSGTPAAALDIYDALSSRDPGKVQEAVQQGAAADGDKDKRLPLCIAAWTGPQLVKALLAAGADPNLKRHGETALSCSVYSGHPDSTRLLIEGGADAKKSDALALAVQAGRPDQIAVLLELGVEPDEREPLKSLILAVLRRDLAGVETALAKGANVRKGSPRPIHCAAATGSAELMKMLIQNGADPKEDWMHLRPIHVAAWAGNTEALRVLVEKGASVDSATNSGHTPLMLSSQRGHVDTFKALLDAGADPKIDVGGVSLLSMLPFSKGRCQPGIIVPAIRGGASTKEVENELLTCASLTGDQDLTRIAIEKGRGVLTPYWVETAFNLALKSGKRTVAQSIADSDLAGAAALRGRLEKEKAASAKAAAAEREKKDRAKAAEEAEKAGDAAAAAGKAQEAVGSFQEALGLVPMSAIAARNRLKGKLLEAALRAGPQEVPEGARHHSLRAQAYIKNATGPDQFKLAAEELEKAVAIAPWWTSAYYNLALAQEKAGDLDGALANLALYQKASPAAEDAANIKRKIAELEVAKEMRGTKPPR